MICPRDFATGSMWPSWGLGRGSICWRWRLPTLADMRCTSPPLKPIRWRQPTSPKALDAFPEAAAIAAPFLDAWARGARRFEIGNITVEVIEGDAREKLAAWDGQANAWFLDGFSPAKNPELWGEDLMLEVGRHTIAGGSFATYTAAGHVRRALDQAGFDVTRTAGFGRKRHMSRGIKREDRR